MLRAGWKKCKLVLEYEQPHNNKEQEVQSLTISNVASMNQQVEGKICVVLLHLFANLKTSGNSLAERSDSKVTHANMQRG